MIDGCTSTRRTRIARKPNLRENLDDRSLLQFASGGDAAAARVLVERYAGGLYAFVHARVGSLLAADATAEIFASTLRALDEESIVEGSIARTLHEHAIETLILDGQHIRDQRLDRLADVLAAESIVADPAPEPVVTAALGAVVEAAPEIPAHLVDGPTALAATPRPAPREPEMTLSRPSPPVPPLPRPVVPESKDRALRLVLVLLVAAIVAVVVAVALYGDLESIRNLELFGAPATAIGVMGLRRPRPLASAPGPVLRSRT
ncbi:MAG: hypothetical protein R3249_00975 [Nitriliruptorales bacterium]|nr:hypothetical protein [Nitriliruptorales bacterium]